MKIAHGRYIRPLKNNLFTYEMNKYLNTIVIAPMTTSSWKYPTRVEIKHDNKIGWIVLDQIRTVDKQRIIKELGRLKKSEMTIVKAVLKETYVD